jgi:polysaccharide pyruvyl transferase WcaK-like protein
VLCALKLSKPTLSIGYATKHEVLMRDMGLGDFCEPARSIDLGRLITKFEAMERHRDVLISTLDQRNTEKARLLEEQFAALSRVVAEPSNLSIEAAARAREEPASP